MADIEVLLVEDSQTDALVIRAHLRSSHLFHVTHVCDLNSALRALDQRGTDVVILDLNLPDSLGLDTFTSIRAKNKDIPVVILSGHEDEQLAVSAVAAGAQDYVPKAMVGQPLLVRALRYAIERQARLLAERRNMQMESDMNIARRIQQRMLPSMPPTVRGFDIGATCEPTSECGGDFFDFIPIDRRRWDVVVADVSSHGFAPALIMVGARRILRSCAQMNKEVGQILTIANRAVAEDTQGEHFVTAFYGRLDSVRGTLEYAAAAHPVWIISDSGEVIALQSGGYPLGLIPEAGYSTLETVQLSPGDILVLPTDGSYEAISERGELFGKSALLRIILQNRHRSAAEICDSLLAEIIKFCAPGAPQDDVTLVVIKVNPSEPTESAA